MQRKTILWISVWVVCGFQCCRGACTAGNYVVGLARTAVERAVALIPGSSIIPHVTLLPVTGVAGASVPANSWEKHTAYLCKLGRCEWQRLS